MNTKTLLRKNICDIRTILVIGAMLVLIAQLCACLSSTSTVTEYDLSTGKVARVTETSESVVKTLENSLQHKSVIVASNGFHIKIQAACDPQKSYSPTGEISASYGMILWASIHKDQQNLDKFPMIFASLAPGLKVDFNGIDTKQIPSEYLVPRNTEK